MSRGSWSECNAGPAAALGLLVSTSVGCGPSMVSTQAYAEAFLGAEDRPSPVWLALTPGKEVVVAAGTGACLEQVADSLDALATAPAKLSEQPWARKASSWTIVDSQVRTASAESQGHLALLLRGAQGEHWLRVESGAELTCVQPASETLTAAMRREGQVMVFTPWKAGCRAIEAGGQAPRSVLLEAEAGSTVQVGKVVFASQSAANAGPGGAIWLELNNGTVRVRADVVHGCFSPADGSGGSIEPPTDASVLLHMAPERCTESDEGGKRHFECTSTVGVWEGETRDKVVSLQLVRRTLGPLHFLDGRPVAGARWAKAVVSVTTGRRTDQRVGALYDVMERTAAEALSGEDGLVRMAADAADPTVTCRVAVEVSKVSIGPLEQHVTNETSQYQDGTRTEPNPEKEASRRALAAAESRVPQEESDYERRVQEMEAAREGCISASNEAADGFGRALLTAGCSLPQVSRDGINEAQAALAQARAHDASTPETIEVPIMKTWPYKKRHFARSTSATLKITMEPTGGAAEAVTISLATQWTDYEVEADPDHNVEGHSPQRGPIDNPEALVPFIAQQANEKLAERLRAAISRATLQEAMKALAASGAPTKKGYEEVDAMAFSLVGQRLKQPVQRDRSTVPANQTPYGLPAQAVSLGPNECLVAVAVAAREGGTTITIVGNGGRHGDLRNKSFAAVEVCASELPDGQSVLDDLGIRSASGAQVRWGMYRSVDGRSAAAASPRPPAPPAPPPTQAPVPATTTAPLPPAGAVGCTKDTDCKGDRVCASGQCVNPR